MLPAQRSSTMPNASGIHLREGAPPWVFKRLGSHDGCPPHTRSGGSTPCIQRGSSAPTQSCHLHASFWGDHDGDWRSSASSNSEDNGNLRKGGLRRPPFTCPRMADRGWTMSELGQALRDYIAVRRSLGFQLRLPAGCLRNFVAFLEAEGASYITTELALRWATHPAKAQPSTWTWRLSMIRRFAKWHRTIDPRTEVPPERILCHRYERKKPHIYSDEEILRLLRQAEQLPSSRGLRAHTYTTLFGLLAVTGMRVNEALGLDRDDVDLDHGIITIRRTKFGKSRHVPVHSSTVEALKQYARIRDRILPVRSSSCFFVSERRTRVTELAWRAIRSRSCLSNWVSGPSRRDTAGGRVSTTCGIDLLHGR